MLKKKIIKNGDTNNWYSFYQRVYDLKTAEYITEEIEKWTKSRDIPVNIEYYEKFEIMEIRIYSTIIMYSQLVDRIYTLLHIEN